MGLAVEGVAKRFGAVQALENVTLRVPKGAVFGLIGPNGAGKTTTMRAILRIVRPDAGRITWEGQPVEALPYTAFGYLPEERGLYPRMRVRDELVFFGELHGMPRRRLKESLETFVELLRMGDIIDRKVEELSKGNAQKVQFAAACLHEPPLVILDEPFAGLDPVNVRLFKKAVGHLRERGTTILFSSHRMEHVEELCDGLCLINAGRVLVEGRVDEVKRSTGRRVLRLAWEPSADGVPAEQWRWFDRLRSEGLSVAERPNNVWQVSWKDDSEGSYGLADRLVQAAGQIGRLRLFELTYPSLEDVYVEVVGTQALDSEEGAA
ncbi:MAG: ATP-binding cassette domain-containing protein [Bacillota bacterium]